MIISSNFLKKSIENYQKSQKQKKIEGFSLISDSARDGALAAGSIFILFIAVIFFMLELILLYYAIFIAMNCSKSREEKIVNFVLAVFFTMPYVLLNILFNDCAKNFLRNGMKKA
jgi:hypothetical protein